MGRPKKRQHTFGLSGGFHSIRRRQRNQPKTVTPQPCTSTTNIPSSNLHMTYRITSSAPLRITIKRKPKRHIPYREANFISSADGYRMIHLSSLKQHQYAVSKHVALCKYARRLARRGQSPIIMLSERRTYGIACHLISRCLGCRTTFKFCTSPRMEEFPRYDINVRAVWGQMATGGGAAKLNETMATMGCPGMSQSTFSSIEEEIGKHWKKSLDEEFTEAIQEETLIATNSGDTYKDMPACSVVCDGGWSKRTHKHSYNALGGVGILVGLKTKKILHLGVRNKYCIICTAANTNNKEPPSHECFKNWEDSSQAMEADIIVEGLKEVEKNGLMITRIIADGDSSTYAAIKEKVPWGRDVKKMLRRMCQPCM